MCCIFAVMKNQEKKVVTRKVVVAIPLYTLHLRHCEVESLRRTLSVLRRRDVAVVAPESLDLSNLPALLGMECCWREERFADHFFAGREGYNRLMTSAEFYERFASEYEYVLVCQTDVWIFQDLLDEMCAMGYDYVGAPWLPARKDVEGFYPLHRLVWRLRRMSGSHSMSLKWHSGNGGLSLRRCAVMAAFARAHGSDIARLCRPERGPQGFEDVFWSVEANRLQPGAVRVAPWREALNFSVESHPDYALRLTRGRLPFGTHAYARHNNRGYWHKFIPSRAFDRHYVG